MPSEPFWPHLLRHRLEASWGNFSWFSPKTLLLSVNDQIAKVIENPDDSGSIVDRRRMRWVATQRLRGHRVETPQRIVDSTGFLALGDPGEMDASQYSLIRPLAARRAEFEAAGVRTALLMSDVVYPAGNVNQWSDAVYLPYLGLPQSRWDAAITDWTAAGGPGPDGVTPPLRTWNLLAFPGNHDWYDGLNGFMYHACRSEPLSDVAYDEQGYSWRERAAQAWWRKPAPPEREMIQPLREQLDGLTGAVGLPNLPGPYYMVDFVGPDPAQPGATRGLFRAVVVDNGITGTVDREQATWLARYALSGPLPKVLITGSPLVVNNTVARLRIPRLARHDLGESQDAAAAADASAPPVTAALSDGSTDLLDLVEPGHRVALSLAGDVHNYQRVVLTRAAADGSSTGVPWKIPLQVVAGGAGAYLSQAHQVRLDPDGALPLTPAAGAHAGGLALRVPAPDHHRFPTREGSVLHYADRRRGYVGSMLFLVLVGLAAFWFWAESARSLVREQVTVSYGLTSAGHVVAPWWALAALTLLVVLIYRAPWQGWFPRRWPFDSPQILSVAVLAAATGLALWHWPQLSLPLVAALASVGYVLLLVVAQALPPLVESFPELRRSWIARTLAATLVGLYLKNSGHSRVLVITAALAGTAAFVLVKAGYRRLMRDLTRRTLGEPPPTITKPSALAAARELMRWLPFGAAGAALVIATMWLPDRLLTWLGAGGQAAGLGALSRVQALAAVLLGVLVITVLGTVVPWWRSARHSMPAWGYLLLVAGPVGGVVVTRGLWADLAAELGTRAERPVAVGWALAGVVPVLAAALGLVGALAVVALSGAFSVPSADQVSAALQARDGHGGNGLARTPSLFTAMMIAGIPSIDSLSEATRPPFHKNVLVVRYVEDGGVPYLELAALGLDAETTGFEPIETTRVCLAAGSFGTVTVRSASDLADGAP